MTYRAVGVPALVELLRMPEFRDRRVTPAAELAAVLEEAANARWRMGPSGPDRPAA